MKTYDTRDVSVVVDGTVLTGFAEGTFVEASKDEDNYEAYVGAQGEVSRSRNANPMGSINVTLKSTSPSNALLNTLAKSNRTFAARVVDRNTGNATAGGAVCWVQKPTGLEWGDEVSEREWTIVVADYDQNIR